MMKNATKKKKPPQPKPEEKPAEVKEIEKKKIEKKDPFSELNIAYLKKFYNDKEFIKENAELLPCENIEIYERASYKNEDIYSIGVLILTKFRLIFKFQDEKQLEKLKLTNSFFKIPLFEISKINKINRSSDKYAIDITLKDSKVVRFFIWTKDNLKFFGDLNELVFPREPRIFFQFSLDYLNYLKTDPSFIDGWKLYDPISEFQRQGVQEGHRFLRFCYVNKEYNVCQSYPSIIITHANVKDEDVRNAGILREKRCLPVMTYNYNKKGMSASIWRSSALRPGITSISNKNCEAILLENIISINKKLYVYNIRPYLNALANKIKGGKEEKVETYFGTRIINCEIDDIQKARQSLQKLYQMSQGSNM